MPEGRRVKARGLLEPISGEVDLRKLSGTADYPSQCPYRELRRFFISGKTPLLHLEVEKMQGGKQNDKHRKNNSRT